MNRSKSLILTLALCILIGGYPKAQYGQDEGDLPDQNDVDSIVIALTHLDVNDLILDVNDQTPDVNNQTLELHWKVKNDSDQDVWLCTSVGWYEDSFEVYMDEDNKTLVIRRRLDVRTWGVYYIWPSGWYVRFRPGEERVESLSLTLPIRHSRMFTKYVPLKKGITYARRLVFEIGYHTKDLAQIILDLKGSDDDPNLYSNAEISYLHSANEGEYVLRITVDGVLIPYEEVPAEYTQAKEEYEP